MIEGFVDRIRGNYVEGWACEPETPEERLVVVAEVDGECVAETVAERDRDDLEGSWKAGTGFRLELPAEVLERPFEVLRIRPEQCSAPLPNGTRLGDAPEADPAANALLAQLRLLRTIQMRHGVSMNYEKILSDLQMSWVAPESVAIDVGANVGDHTHVLLYLVGPLGRVLAFEPFPDLADDLEARFHDAPNLELHRVALRDRAGIAHFMIDRTEPPHSGLADLSREQRGTNEVAEIEVRCETLDHFTASLERVDYVKIDVEGAELQVLAGAKETLSRFRPLISVEYGVQGYSRFGHSPGDLFRAAESSGYAIHDLFGNPIPSERLFLRVVDFAYWDYVLVPKERVEQFNRRFAASTSNGSFGRIEGVQRPSSDADPC